MSTAIAGSLAVTPLYATASDQIVSWDDPGATWRQVLTSGAPLSPSGGGTGTSTVFTSGSVVFAGPSGVYAQDNAHLFWDDGNNQLGVGTASPRGALEVAFSADVPPTALNVAATGGMIIGNPAVSAVGAQLGIYQPVAGNRSTYIQSRNTDASSLARWLLLNPLGGNVGIGTAAPACALDTNGTIRAIGVTTPTGGAGIELLYSAGTGYLVAYDRTGAVSLPLVLSSLNWGVTGPGVVNLTGLTASGGPDLTTAWQTTTPTVTASTGTFTTVAGAVRYKAWGKLVFINIKVTITTNGTAAVTVIVPLPVNANVTNGASVQTLSGREIALTGKGLQGYLNATQCSIVAYDNSYPGANGNVLCVSGVYEAA